MKDNERIKKLKSKLEHLKKLADDEVVQSSYGLKNNFRYTIESIENEIRREECELKRSDLVGKYFEYVNNSQYKEYDFVRKIKGEDIVCDRIIFHETKTGPDEIDISKNQESSDYKVENFREITKDEFFKVYREACESMVEKGLFGTL